MSISSPVSAPTQPHHQPLLGMACGVAAYMFYTVQDTLISLMGNIYPPLQVTWIDCTVALTVMLGVVIARKGLGGLKLVFHTHHLKLHLVRALFFAIGAAMVFSAIPHVPLPNMYVIVFIAPLLAASFSGVFLKEPASRGKFAAIILGFIGLLVALRPGHEGFNIYSLLILGAACLFSVNALLNRHLARKDHAVVLIYYPLTMVAALYAVVVLPGFQPIALQHFPHMIGMGLALAAALFLNARSFCYAPVYLNAPCQFLQLIWGSLAQFFVYGTVADHFTFIGGALIIFSNLFMIYLQYRRKDAPA